MDKTDSTTIQLQCPFTCIIAGATGSGKSTLLFKILRQGDQVFLSPPKQIIYCYGIYQTLYDDMKSHLSHIRFYEGLPTKDDLESWAAVEPGHKVLVLDDLMQRAVKDPDIADLFCQFSHHLNFSTIFVAQNLFADGMRCLSLNTHYFILLKNSRGVLQVQTLGKQILQIAYNVLQGAREVSTKDVNKLAKHKLVIHRFVAKETTRVRRVQLLARYLDIILPLLKAIEKDLK